MGDIGKALQDWRAIVICLFVSIGALQFGYDQSYFSGILVMDQFVEHYGSYDSATGKHIITASTQSLVTSIINAGEFVGALTASLISDHTGLRGGLFIATVTVAIGTTLQIAGTYIGLLIVGRLVLGYAVGLISCFLPLYMADCSPPKLRGALVTMYQMNIGIGLIIGVCVDYATKDRTDTGAFRIPIAVQYIFPIILGSGLLLFVPESPRWLASKNRIAECEKSLRRLKGNDNDIQEDLEIINSSLHNDSVTKDSSWLDILKSPVEMRKAYLGWAIQALQQGSGINFITGYGVYFFTVIGIKNPFLIQVSLYLVGFPPTWFCQYALEKFGRRPLLLISGFFMALATLTMGGLGLNSNPSYAISQGIVGLVFFYMISFSVGWGPVVWVVCSEVSTGRNRNKLMTISTCSNWFFNWLVSFTFPYLFNADAANLQTRVGFIYGSIMVLATVWVYFLLPETSQRSLEGIQELFERRVSARKFSSTNLERSLGGTIEEKLGANITQLESAT